MDYSVFIHYGSYLMAAMAILVFSVNIIVEVVKHLFPRIPTTFLATALSVALTVTAFFIWTSYVNFAAQWQHVAAAVALGLFVAYAAMFSFDKFKQALTRLREHKK